MNREDIIAMALEAGGLPDPMVFIGAYERFAALVAAAEREACAMEADYEAARWAYSPEAREPCEEVAKAIRARGQA
jgi:hypothetical protein